MKLLLVLLATSPILIPVYYNGGGRNDSGWFTNAFVNNLSGEDLPVGDIEAYVECPPVPEGCTQPFLKPGRHAYIGGPDSLRGFLLHPSAENADDIEVQVNFGNGALYPSLFLGVEMPVARERDFRTTRFGLTFVPVGGVGRTMLRIYSPDSIPGQLVTVELRAASQPQSPVFTTTLVTLDAIDFRESPTYPAFAQLQLEDLAGRPGFYRVDIIPRTSGTHTPRVWAFATFTHNVTNDVTVISPQ